MSLAKLFILLVSGLLAASCVSIPTCPNGPVQFKNKSELTLKQSYTASEAAFYVVQKFGNCRCGIDSIEVQQDFTKKSPDYKLSASGHVVSGDLTERWLAYGCGKAYPFDVKIVPDGKGGTDIYTSRVVSEWPQ